MIRLTIHDAVAEVVLDAPAKLNAVNLQALHDLGGAYDDAEAAGVRALVLRGEGRAFCAGRDIAGVDPRTDDVPEYLGAVEALMRHMSAFPAPTFAAAQGACLGVGPSLLIATDVVYVAESAKIGSPFAARGAALDSGGHALFVERLGAHRALDLIYTGRLMSGAEAVAAGLFSRVFPDDEVMAATTEAASRAASGATLAFRRSKEIVQRIRDERLGLWQALSLETAAQSALRESADYREGFAAFQEKRMPEFRGR